MVFTFQFELWLKNVEISSSSLYLQHSLTELEVSTRLRTLRLVVILKKWGTASEVVGTIQQNMRENRETLTSMRGLFHLFSSSFIYSRVWQFLSKLQAHDLWTSKIHYNFYKILWVSTVLHLFLFSLQSWSRSYFDPTGYSNPTGWSMVGHLIGHLIQSHCWLQLNSTQIKSSMMILRMYQVPLMTRIFLHHGTGQMSTYST